MSRLYLIPAFDKSKKILKYSDIIIYQHFYYIIQTFKICFNKNKNLENFAYKKILLLYIFFCFFFIVL